MLKRPITYENFDGETVTETFYFNISKAELVEMEVEYPRGLASHLDSIMKSEDNKLIIETIKKLILIAYGIRDGDAFMKSDEIRDRFSHTAAYQHLFMELGLDANAAADWVMGVLPQDMVADVQDKLKDHMAEALGTVPPADNNEADKSTEVASTPTT